MPKFKKGNTMARRRLYGRAADRLFDAAPDVVRTTAWSCPERCHLSFAAADPATLAAGVRGHYATVHPGKPVPKVGKR